MNLWQDFLLNKDKAILKWTHYFPIYERHFAPWQNRTMTFWEIGVLYGGSLQMWQRYFGPMARIIGLDKDATCRQHESPGISIRTGDQSDPVFLQSVIDEFGPPDVILDDGGHQMHQLFQTFQMLYPLLPKNGVYMIEDLHTCYWKEYGGGKDEPNSFVNIAKRFIDDLHANYTRGEIEPNIITRETYGISFYDSIVAFDKGQPWRFPGKTGRDVGAPADASRTLRSIDDHDTQLNKDKTAQHGT